MINEQIHSYKILSLLGEGGMGNVYLAEHVSISRKVAIKVLKPELVKNEEIRLRFKNEASMLAHIQHPNIVGLIDYVEHDGGLFLIMEYVEGQGLDDFIKAQEAPISIERAKKLMIQIVEAFIYAHKSGIVHRDVKPSNILITSDDQIKVLDFGIAKLVGEGNHHLTKTGTQIGTVYYMSPEQVRGQVLDFRSDIYSLGVTFYELLTGVCPYKSFVTEYEIYDHIVKEPLLDLTQTMGVAYQNMWRIISKATEKEVSNRYQSTLDFVKDLKSEDKQNSVVDTSKQNIKNVQDKSVNDTSKSKTWIFLVIAIVLLVSGYFIFQQNFRNKTPISSELPQLKNNNTEEEKVTVNNKVEEPKKVSEEESQTPYFPLNHVKNKIEKYYSSVSSSEYDAWDFWASNVLQFINLKNTNPDKLNENHQNNTDFVASEVNIMNDDVQFDHKEGSIDYWVFWVDFSCYRTSKEKYQFCNIKVKLGTDQNLDFVYYEELDVTNLRFE